MGLRSIHILIMLLLFSASQAQFNGVEIAVSKNYRMLTPGAGFDPGGNGVSLRANLNFHLNEKFISSVGGELGANGIGNYVSSAIGIHRLFDHPGGKFSFSAGLTTQHGIALFHPSGLYVLGIGEVNSLCYHLKEGRWIAMFVEFRYYSSPGYARISEINSFLDLQIGLQFSLF